jgi:PAS domain S-box-containing protein
VALGGVITAVGAVVVNLLATRHRLDKEARADTLKEWQELTDRLQRRVDDLNAEVLRLQKSHARCQVENAELRGELKLLQATVQRLQGLAGDEPPTTTQPAIITTDLDGVIRQVSPAVTPMFHWLVRELIGKSVEVLIPGRYAEAHRRGMEAIRTTGVPPWAERVILGHGLTKDGQEFPVTVTLSGWQDKGKWMLSAEVRRRVSQPQTPQGGPA